MGVLTELAARALAGKQAARRGASIRKAREQVEGAQRKVERLRKMVWEEKLTLLGQGANLEIMDWLRSAADDLHSAYRRLYTGDSEDDAVNEVNLLVHAPVGRMKAILEKADVELVAASRSLAHFVPSASGRGYRAVDDRGELSILGPELATRAAKLATEADSQIAMARYHLGSFA